MNRNGLHLGFRTLSFLDSHTRDREQILEIRSRPSRRLLVWHPDAVDWIFRSDRRLRHAHSRTLAPLLGRTSLLWAEGSRHAAYRQVLGPRLRGRGLANYHDIITSTVHAAIDDLPPGRVIRLPEWTRQLTLRIFGQILLNRADSALLEPVTERIERVLGSRLRTLAFRYLRRRPPRSTVDDRLVAAATAAAAEQPSTLAGALLSGEAPLGELGEHELGDQLLSLLFAGHETTASATAWTLFWLDRHEALRRDVQAELAETSHDATDASRVPLLHAVVQESLRRSPPATMAGNRIPTEDGELLGEPMPAGTVLTPSIYLAHHDPARFPDPYRFDPHRFLHTRVPGQQYFPFGGGVRRCLGSDLALLEIRMITAAVLRRRDMVCVNPEQGVPRLRGPAMAPAPALSMAVRACLD